MSSTPLPAIVAIIISAYILSATFGRSRAEEQMAGAPPKSDNGHSSAMNSGGDSSLKQKLGEQMKSELVTKIQGTPSGNGWVSHNPKLQISHT